MQLVPLEVVPPPGLDGILGTRASLMMDIVVLAMFLVIPVLVYSIYVVRRQRRYELHRRIQLGLGLSLLVAITLFEFDIQYISPWEDRAEASPYFEREAKWTSPVGVSLLVHLLFAVPTAVLWVVVIIRAVRHFPRPTAPAAHSRSHVRWARPAAFGMIMTAVTGWFFYVLAFVL